MLLLADISNWLFLLGVALMTIILLRRSWRRQSRLRRPSSHSNGKPARHRPARDGIPNQPLADAPAELLRWQVEMHETARELSAQLDSKIVILRQLTQTAERQIALFREQNGSVTERAPSRLEAIEGLVGRSSETAEKALAEFPPPSSPSRPAADRDHVYSLSDLGVSTRSIASQLGMPLGDVELLLSLRGGSPST